MLIQSVELVALLGAYKPVATGNHRNGTSDKTILTEEGPLRIDVPRDRASSFEPVLIYKHERRSTGLERDIIQSIRWGS